MGTNNPDQALKLERELAHGELAKIPLFGPIPRASNSVFVGWGRVTSISDLFPGDPDASGQGTAF